eukprot:s4970_g2.t1
MKKFLGMIGLSVLVCSYVYNILKFALHHYMAWIILLRKPSFCMCPVGCVCGCLAVQLYGGLDNVTSLRPAGASTANARWKPTADESASLMTASPEARSDQMPVPIVLGHSEDVENGARGSTLTL